MGTHTRQSKSMFATLNKQILLVLLQGSHSVKNVFLSYNEAALLLLYFFCLMLGDTTRTHRLAASLSIHHT